MHTEDMFTVPQGSRPTAISGYNSVIHKCGIYFQYDKNVFEAVCLAVIIIGKQ